MEWISVKDSLPKWLQNPEFFDFESEDVLIVEESGKMFVAYFCKYTKWELDVLNRSSWNERGTSCGCCTRELNPTHWMPLPAIPKG